MSSDPRSKLNQEVFHAIRGALREEKRPRALRAAKIVGSTLACATLLGIPFLLSFKTQLNWAWGVAWALWTLLLFTCFCLHYSPQPRLMAAGVWSPFVVARTLLIATVATVLQILICPSFVFLSGASGWNPLAPVTNALMSLGGMNLCMFFCGFLFSFVSGLLSLIFVGKVAKSRSIRGALTGLGLLILAQVPVLVVQLLSEDLREFVPFWSLGLLVGCALALALLRLNATRPVYKTRASGIAK